MGRFRIMSDNQRCQIWPTGLPDYWPWSQVVQVILEGCTNTGSDGRSTATHHKEETAGRKKLSNCIDPLDPQGHPTSILNIVNGKVADQKVNVDNAV